MTRLRARVAERLKGAQNTYAMLTTFNEIDMTNLMQLRADYKACCCASLTVQGSATSPLDILCLQSTQRGPPLHVY